MEERIYKKYFTGRAKPGQWASVYVYKPHNHEIKVKRGEIFAIISLSAPESFAVSTAGNLILDNLHENYFENQNDSALLALEKAVKAASVYLQKLLENDTAADVGVDFDLIAMTVLGDVIYYVSLGNNVSKVWRGGRLTEMSSLLKDPTGEGILKVGSMVATEGDIFFLATNEFEKEVSEDSYIELAESFSDLPLKQRIYENEARVAFLMVGYDLNFENLQQSVMQKVDSAQDQDSEAIEEEHIPSNAELDKLDDIEDVEIVAEAEEMADEVEMADEDFQPLRTSRAKSMPKLKFNFNLAAIGVHISDIFTNLKSKIPQAAPRHPTQQHVAKVLTDGDLDALENKPTALYLLAKAGDAFKKAARLVWEDWLGMGQNSKNLRGSARNKRWGFLFIVALVIGGLIYFSVQDSLKTQKQKATELQAQQYINQADAALVKLETDAKVIAKSNLSTERKSNFLQQLDEAKAILDKARGIDKVAVDVQKEDAKIMAINNLLNKTIQVTNPQIVVDTGAQNPGSNLSDLAIGNNSIFYADQQYGKVYSANYDGKNQKELTTGLDHPLALTYDTTGNLVFLDNSTDRRMGVIDLADNSVQRVAGTSNNKIGGVTKMYFMVLDAKAKKYRIYTVDPAAKAVSYLETSDGIGYGLPIKKSVNFAELGVAKDISITDLKIYLLAPHNQGFYRAYGDKDDTPVIAGLNPDDSFVNASAMYVDDQYMYIADSASQSIYVMTKDNPPSVTTMQFKAKYTYKGSENYFKDIKEIVADRAAGKIFVLDGSRVFVLPMNELANF